MAAEVAGRARCGLPVFIINQVPSLPLIDTAQALADRGHSVSVLAAESRLSHSLRGVEEVGLCEYDSRTYWTRVRSWLWFTVQATWCLLGAPASSVVVVCTNPPVMPYIATLVGLVRGFTCVLRVLDVYPDVLLAAGFDPRALLFRWLVWCNRWTFARCGAITTLGDTMGDSLAAYGARSRIHVIPEWIVTPEPNAVSVGSRRQGRFTVLASGNVGLTHDLTPLADACRILADEDIQFIVSTDDDTAIRCMFAGFHNVKMVPRFSDTEYERAIIAADVGFISLRRGAETASCPSRLLAYLARGLPVIAVTERPSDLATIIDKGPCGLVVKPDSGGNGVARAIRYLITDAEKRSAFSYAAFALAVSDFNRDARRSELIDLIERPGVLRAPGRRGGSAVVI